MAYNFTELPQVESIEELRKILSEEFKSIAQNFNETIELELRASKHEPTRPREGMVVHADGTSWDPGSGQGTYRYQSGVWVKIPSPSDITSAFTRTITLVGDTDYTILPTDYYVFTSAAFTAARTWTLPAASAVPPQHEIIVFDRLRTITTTNTLVVQRAGSDVIDNGIATSLTLNTTPTGLRFISDGVSHWEAHNLFLGGGPILDRFTTTRGSILYRGSGNWAGLAPNTAGFVLTDGGAGADPNWAVLPSAGGLTLITSASFPAATTWSITGLGGYKILLVSLRGVQQNSGGNRGVSCALSGNNGSSYGAAKTITAALANNLPVVGPFLITRTDQVNNQAVGPFTIFTTAVLSNQVDTSSLGPVNAIQLSWNGGATNFTAGDVDVYGLK